MEDTPVWTEAEILAAIKWFEDQIKAHDDFVESLKNRQPCDPYEHMA